MPRDLPVGNGELMVAFDDRYQARDLFWPRVGMPNHAQGYPQRLGFWVDGQFAWVDDDEWQRDLRYKPETLATDCLLRHDGLGIAVRCSDVVDYHSPVWFRSFEVEDLTGKMRDARIFIHHDLSIDASPVGDTAYFDPELQGVVHYKDQRWFLVAGEDPLRYGVEHFTTGTKRIGDAEGTWPGAFCITNALGTRREVFNAVPQRIFTCDQEPTLVFVVHHTLKFRIEIGGVPHRRRINGQVVVDENARVPHLSGEVFHFEGTEPHRRVIIHNIRAAHGDAQTIVPQQTVGCECLGLVAQVTLPLVVVDPSKLAIHPEPKTLRVPLRVVRHPNPRPEQVTGLVAVVECNHQFAVADGQITRHGTSLRRGVSDAKGSKCTAGRIVAVQSSVSRSSSLAKAEMRAAGSPTLVICTAARSPSRHA